MGSTTWRPAIIEEREWVTRERLANPRVVVRRLRDFCDFAGDFFLRARDVSGVAKCALNLDRRRYVNGGGQRPTTIRRA